MRRLKIEYIIIIAMIVLFIFTYNHCNNWYDKLSSKDRRLTTANVYETYTTKSRYYKYIYQVGNNFYSASTTGTNVHFDGDSLELTTFIVVYYAPDPAIHTVIWSYRLDTVSPIGRELDTLTIDKNLIKHHTVGWDGLSAKADINDQNEISKYERIINVPSK